MMTGSDPVNSVHGCHFLSAPPPQVTRLPLVLEGSLNFSYQPKGRGPTPDTLATATTTATDPVLPT